MKKKWMAWLLSGAMICAMGTQVLAAEGADSGAGEPVPHSVLYYGQVTGIQRDEEGAVTRLELDSQRYGAYWMNVSDQTVWIDSGERTASDPDTLEVGEGVYVFHSPAATASLPPQSGAYGVVRNVPQDTGCAKYEVAERVSWREDGSLDILTDNGGLIITAGANTELSSYQGDTPVTLEDIQEGAMFMAWYDIVLETYPGQTYASHIMLLPAAREEPSQQPREGSQLTMELDGKVPNMVGWYESGTAMVPVAAVAKDLGLQVTYQPNTDQGTLVTVESDSFAVRMYLDRNLIYGVTKIPGAVGMTGPQTYGKAPYIVDPGTTWAPAEIFSMLGKTVTLEGTNLVIE